MAKRITLRPDHTKKVFLKRTMAAQLHLFGAVIALFALVTLMGVTSTLNGSGEYHACIAFGLTAILVFAVSACYHFLHDGFQISDELAAVFENLDHTSIYLFIAGTYTPVILNTLEQGDWVFGISVVWSVAIAGITYTFAKPYLPQWLQNRYLSTFLFVAMGWLAIFKIQTVLSQLSTAGTVALSIGVLSYTLGAVVYAANWPRFRNGFFGSHELWHTMVLVGFFAHFMMILDFYRPIAG